MMRRDCWIVLSIFFAFTPPLSAAHAASVDDEMENKCNFNFNDAGCKKACAAAEAKKGKAHAYDNVSHVTRKNCNDLLREAELKTCRATRRCSASACLYRVTGRWTKDGTGVFHGSGITVRVIRAPFPKYAGGRLFYLEDRSGKVTRFEECGSCGISDLSYEAGPLKGARISNGSGNSLMVSIPR